MSSKKKGEENDATIETRTKARILMKTKTLAKPLLTDQRLSNTDFESLYFDFYPRVKKQILYNAGAQYADDIAQEVFFKIYKKIGSFNNESKLETWIYKITLNTCYDFLRKKERRFKLFFSLKKNIEITNSLTSEDNSSDNKAELQAAVLKLDKLSKPVFTLFYFSGLDIRSIAQTLDIPEGTVKSRLNKARTQIKKHFNMEAL